jgi:hypothetical protein
MTPKTKEREDRHRGGVFGDEYADSILLRKNLFECPNWPEDLEDLAQVSHRCYPCWDHKSPGLGPLDPIIFQRPFPQPWRTAEADNNWA